MLSRKQLVAAVWQRLVMGGFSLQVVKDGILGMHEQRSKPWWAIRCTMMCWVKQQLYNQAFLRIAVTGISQKSRYPYDRTGWPKRGFEPSKNLPSHLFQGDVSQLKGSEIHRCILRCCQSEVFWSQNDFNDTYTLTLKQFLRTYRLYLVTDDAYLDDQFYYKAGALWFSIQMDSCS